ncbi:MAG: MarR family winged helix-turn-helix transcriptional regulator [Methylotenera sp.]
MKKHGTTPMGRLLLDAFNWFDTGLLTSLKEQGWPDLSHSQSMVMAYLASDGIRISELARRLGVSRQAAQKSVKELERLKLVKTEIDPTNSSAKTVVLTDQGKANVTAALNTFSEIESQLSKRIGSADLASMRKMLEKDWGAPVIVKKNV